MLYVFYEQPKKYKFSFEEWDKVEEDNKNKELENKKARLQNRKIKIKKEKNKRDYKINTKIRPVIFKRDNHRCVKCGSTENITIHHKLRKGKGGDDSEKNLMTLCYKCHAEEHKNEPIYNAMIKHCS